MLRMFFHLETDEFQILETAPYTHRRTVYMPKQPCSSEIDAGSSLPAVSKLCFCICLGAGHAEAVA